MENHMQLAPEIVDSRRRYLCRHIFTNGRRCASPALRGNDFCYYHRAARPPMALAGRTGLFTMPRIDERAAIQIALFEILSRISAGEIDLKRANSLLYGLQIASSNLPRAAGDQAPALPADAPLVEEIIRDFHLGDLAPIAEILLTDSALPPSPAPLPDTIVLSEAIPLSGTPETKDPDTAPCCTSDGIFLPSLLEPAGAPTHGTASAAECVEEGSVCEGPPAHNRVPIPPSCYAHSPQVIPADAAERARVAEEIHSAVQSAAHRTRPAISPEVPAFLASVRS